MLETETPPVPPAMLGRALLAKLDPESTTAIIAAVSEEVQKVVTAQAVATARAELEEEFRVRQERLLDRLARERRQFEQEADARVDQELEAALTAERQAWDGRRYKKRARVKGGTRWRRERNPTGGVRRGALPTLARYALYHGPNPTSLLPGAIRFMRRPVQCPLIVYTDMNGFICKIKKEPPHQKRWSERFIVHQQEPLTY